MIHYQDKKIHCTKTKDNSLTKLQLCVPQKPVYHHLV